MTFTVEQIEANASKLSKYKHTVHLNAEISAMLLDYAAMKRREAECAPVEMASDALCKEDDGCPTEMAVLKRFWRANQTFPPSQPSTGVPDGYALVPKRIFVDAKSWEAAQYAFGGPGTGEGEDFMPCTLWFGDIENDDGSKTHGLHVNCDECPEEGSVTISELAAAPRSP